MVRGIRNLLLIKVVQMEFLILCLFVSSGGVIGVVESIEKNSSKVKLLVEDTISSQHLTFKIESQGQSIFALLNGYDEKTGEFRLLQIGDPVEIKKGSLVSTSGLGEIQE